MDNPILPRTLTKIKEKKMSVFPSMDETIKQIRAEYDLSKDVDCCRVAMCVVAKITIDNIVKEIKEASKIKVVADPLQRFDYKGMIMEHLSALAMSIQRLNKYITEIKEIEEKQAKNNN